MADEQAGAPSSTTRRPPAPPPGPFPKAGGPGVAAPAPLRRRAGAAPQARNAGATRTAGRSSRRPRREEQHARIRAHVEWHRRPPATIRSSAPVPYASTRPHSRPATREQHRFRQRLPHQPEPPAPSETRTAISRCRAAPRASSRLATLVHAMRSNSPTTAINTTSGCAKRSRTSESRRPRAPSRTSWRGESERPVLPPCAATAPPFQRAPARSTLPASIARPRQAPEMGSAARVRTSRVAARCPAATRCHPANSRAATPATVTGTSSTTILPGRGRELQPAVPERPAQHRHRCGRVHAVVLGADQAAQGGLYSEHREEVPDSNTWLCRA